MHYFRYEKDREIAKNKWKKSQFDFADIVLSLTDNKIFYGTKIYAFFSRPEILVLVQYFSFDFKKVKQELGVCGDYVKREGNIFMQTFNPPRNKEALSLSKEEMKRRAKKIYFYIFEDLNTIIKAKGLV